MLKKIGWLLALPFTTHSEEKSTRSKSSIGGYYAHEDADEMAAQASQWMLENSPTPVPPIQSGGGGMLVQLGRFVLDMGGIGAGLSEKPDRSDDDALAGVGGGGLNIGWMLIDNGWLRVYPLVGPGGWGGRLEAGPANDRTVSSWASLVLNTGLGIDLTLRIGHLGITFGLRMGIRHAIMGVEQGDLVNLPEPRNGPYVQFVAGPRWIP